MNPIFFVLLSSCCLLLTIHQTNGHPGEYHFYRSIGEFLRGYGLGPVESILAVPATTVHHFTQLGTGYVPPSELAPAQFATNSLPTYKVSSASAKDTSRSSLVSTAATGTKCECAPVSSSSPLVQARHNNELLETLLASVKSAQDLDEAINQMQSTSGGVATQLTERSGSESVISHLNQAVATEQSTHVGLENAAVNVHPLREARFDVLAPAVESANIGMPVLSVIGHQTLDQTPSADALDEEFVLADKELKQVHVDLDRIIENLDKDNQRLHGAMFKALRAYVTSIQKRLEHQHKAFASDKVTGISQKIVALKAKIAEALLKLKLKLTLKPIQSLTASGPVMTFASSNYADARSVVAAPGPVAVVQPVPSAPLVSVITPSVDVRVDNNQVTGTEVAVAVAH